MKDGPAQRLYAVANLGKVRAVWGGYASVFITGLGLRCAEDGEPGRVIASRLLVGRLATVDSMLRDPRLVEHAPKLRAEAAAYVLALEALDGVQGKGAA
jgi:hypothetical protein